MAGPTGPVTDARSIRSMLQYEIDRLGHLRERTSVRTSPGLLARVDHALISASCPMCAEAQADGVPCTSLEKECEHCSRALEAIRRARSELELEARHLEAALLGGRSGPEVDPP
jgi:hypothetical protein